MKLPFGLYNPATSEDTPRFGFGRNWRSFLARVDKSRIQAAEDSLTDWLSPALFDGASFLDIGSGSGIFSLAARRLGATVHSFDYDPDSVACTRSLRDEYRPGDEQWTVEQGSILDDEYVRRLGIFDLVYSWGVLHHTGDMEQAMRNAGELVRFGGYLYLSIYNDQGKPSERWREIKRLYNRSPGPVRGLILALVGGYLGFRHLVRRLVYGKSRRGGKELSSDGPRRGMSYWHDLVDWVGGYPFEVAKPEDVVSCYRKQGFELCRLRTVGGREGCNEFLFCRKDTTDRK